MSETKTGKVCSFCDKKQSEVAQLVARHETGLAICDECIGVSVEILLKHLKRSRAVSSEEDMESKLDTLRMEVKLLRQGKGWAEERAMEAETALRAVRKWWKGHVRETWAEPDGSDRGYIHTSREGLIVIQELVGVLKPRSEPSENETAETCSDCWDYDGVKCVNRDPSDLRSMHLPGSKSCSRGVRKGGNE